MSLTLQHLRAARPSCVFPPVSIALEEGEALLLRGENGSGKSTLLRTLAGLLPAHSGKIAQAHDVLYIGHASGINPHLSAAEHLSFWAGLAGIADYSIDEILKKIGLYPFANMRAGKLSAGQQRRLTLARLLLEKDKKLWLLDEPQAGLDAEGIALLQRLIADHRKTGGICIIAIHQGLNVDDAKELSLRGAE